MNIILFVLSLFATAGQTAAPGNQVPMANNTQVAFEIKLLHKKCTAKCVVIYQKLTNKSKNPVALAENSQSLVTLLNTAVTPTEDSYMPPGTASMTIGESLGDDKPLTCKVLKPGESMINEAKIAIPQTIRRGTSVYLQQEYRSSSYGKCQGTELFHGASASNRITFTYK
jgi:hypothetical protein